MQSTIENQRAYIVSFVESGNFTGLQECLNANISDEIRDFVFGQEISSLLLAKVSEFNKTANLNALMKFIGDNSKRYYMGFYQSLAYQVALLSKQSRQLPMNIGGVQVAGVLARLISEDKSPQVFAECLDLFGQYSYELEKIELIVEAVFLQAKRLKQSNNLRQYFAALNTSEISKSKFQTMNCSLRIFELVYSECIPHGERTRLIFDILAVKPSVDQLRAAALIALINKDIDAVLKIIKLVPPELEKDFYHKQFSHTGYSLALHLFASSETKIVNDLVSQKRYESEENKLVTWAVVACVIKKGLAYDESIKKLILDNLDYIDKNGNNVLHFIAANTSALHSAQAIEIIDDVVDKRPDLLNNKNKSGIVPIVLAASCNANVLARHFLSIGANLDVVNKTSAALQIIMTGNLELIRYMYRTCFITEEDRDLVANSFDASLWRNNVREIYDTERASICNSLFTMDISSFAHNETIRVQSAKISAASWKARLEKQYDDNGAKISTLNSVSFLPVYRNTYGLNHRNIFHEAASWVWNNTYGRLKWYLYEALVFFGLYSIDKDGLTSVVTLSNAWSVLRSGVAKLFSPFVKDSMIGMLRRQFVKRDVSETDLAVGSFTIGGFGQVLYGNKMRDFIKKAGASARVVDNIDVSTVTLDCKFSASEYCADTLRPAITRRYDLMLLQDRYDLLQKYRCMYPTLNLFTVRGLRGVKKEILDVQRHILSQECMTVHSKSAEQAFENFVQLIKHKDLKLVILKLKSAGNSADLRQLNEFVDRVIDRKILMPEDVIEAARDFKLFMSTEFAISLSPAEKWRNWRNPVSIDSINAQLQNGDSEFAKYKDEFLRIGQEFSQLKEASNPHSQSCVEVNIVKTTPVTPQLHQSVAHITNLAFVNSASTAKTPNSGSASIISSISNWLGFTNTPTNSFQK